MNREKIVYIGGHHELKRTRSSLFLVEMLETSFDIEVLITDEWTESRFPDLSYIDNTYLAVILFQGIPFRATKTIRCKNITHFPMFDVSGSDPFDEWLHYSHFKMIVFCHRLHKRLASYGMDSTYLQYFPKPKLELIEEVTDKSIFFWYRSPEISLEFLEGIIDLTQVERLHLHDPSQQNVDIDALRSRYPDLIISMSHWFADKSDFLQTLCAYRFFVAPRPAEGIGMSFLDAMACGLIVIAADYPTMNEYIFDGKNGILFDRYSPRRVSLENTSGMRNELQTYMTTGYAKWESEKHQILGVLRRSCPQNQNKIIVLRIAAWSVRVLRSARAGLRRLFVQLPSWARRHA